MSGKVWALGLSVNRFSQRRFQTPWFETNFLEFLDTNPRVATSVYRRLSRIWPITSMLRAAKLPSRMGGVSVELKAEPILMVMSEGYVVLPMRRRERHWEGVDFGVAPDVH
jgi:hypothetical protein